MFPAVDPIPLPAPVWLMKLLSHVTLALHFSAVMILIGSLLLIVWHNAIGRSKKNSDQVSISYVMARRLPVVMTWVINLGVPPLLFAQVLYGRAIYSSSVLIGVLWFCVIPLLMLAYWLLYATVSRIEAGKSAWPTAFGALFVAASIGQIYSMNMTLMLRPEVWQAMYANSPSGLQGVTGDPTMTPRFMFVMSGGLVFGGLWALTLSNMGHISDAVKKILCKSGGAVATLGVVAQGLFGWKAATLQSDAVKAGLAGSSLYSISGYLFLAMSALAAVLAITQGMKAKSSVLFATLGLATGFLGTAGAVLYRDGIRDFTLQQKGFNVWERTEVSNWSVIGIFLFLFVIMLAVVFWLLMVMRKASVPNEQVTL